MPTSLQVLLLLRDGRFHSGEALSQKLGVSRTMIWKVIHGLQQDFSLEVQSVRGRGYRLTYPIELLDEDLIQQQLNVRASADLSKIEILPVVDSTNRYLMAAMSQGRIDNRLVFAEQQTDGRGRRGRHWISPFGTNLYLSLLWHFNLSALELTGLGVAVAVALAEVLAPYSRDIRIKWPNDILWQGRKLAGILIEMQTEANGPASAVIGIGLNLRMPVFASENIDQPWADLQQACGHSVPRNEVAAALINRLVETMNEYQCCGIQAFLPRWREYDVLKDRQVSVVLGEQPISGIARGVDDAGALLLEQADGIHRYMAGEVTLEKTN